MPREHQVKKSVPVFIHSKKENVQPKSKKKVEELKISKDEESSSEEDSFSEEEQSSSEDETLKTLRKFGNQKCELNQDAIALGFGQQQQFK
jgi:hypothetical protein